MAALKTLAPRVLEPALALMSKLIQYRVIDVTAADWNEAEQRERTVLDAVVLQICACFACT